MARSTWAGRDVGLEFFSLSLSFSVSVSHELLFDRAWYARLAFDPLAGLGSCTGISSFAGVVYFCTSFSPALSAL